MKKVVNGIMYNTATATRIAGWESGNMSDFAYCCECLYQKKNGEFFIHGEGGPLTVYAKHYDGCSGYGERIEPITEDDARIWCERHLDGDAFEKIFGPTEE